MYLEILTGVINMKIRTHINLAKLSLMSRERDYPPNFSFIFFYFGTIIADLCWLPYIHPHFFSKSEKYIYNKIEKLISRKNFSIYESIQLGIINHYICDFCCYVHITGDVGRVDKHVIYEHNINEYLLKNFEEFRKEDFIRDAINYDNAFIKKFIKDEVLKYKEGQHSYDWDIVNAIKINSIVCESILSFFLVQNKEFNLCLCQNFVLQILCI